MEPILVVRIWQSVSGQDILEERHCVVEDLMETVPMYRGARDQRQHTQEVLRLPTEGATSTCVGDNRCTNKYVTRVLIETELVSPVSTYTWPTMCVRACVRGCVCVCTHVRGGQWWLVLERFNRRENTSL